MSILCNISARLSLFPWFFFACPPCSTHNVCRPCFSLHICVFIWHTESYWECKVSPLGISSRVNCIINSQAAKRQAWLEFTLEPSLSHRHNSALCMRLCVRYDAINKPTALSVWRKETSVTNSSIYVRYWPDTDSCLCTKHLSQCHIHLLYVCECLLFPLFLAFSDISLFLLYILFLFTA